MLLGQALIDLKLIERSELDQAVTEQILSCAPLCRRQTVLLNAVSKNALPNCKKRLNVFLNLASSKPISSPISP